MEETELEIAQRHVTEGRRIVAEQRERVARLKISSRDFHAAQKDLELYADSLAIFEADLAALLANKAPTTSAAGSRSSEAPPSCRKSARRARSQAVCRRLHGLGWMVGNRSPVLATRRWGFQRHLLPAACLWNEIRLNWNA